jgi:uncharacterized protein YggE
MSKKNTYNKQDTSKKKTKKKSNLKPERRKKQTAEINLNASEEKEKHNNAHEHTNFNEEKEDNKTDSDNFVADSGDDLKEGKNNSESRKDDFHKKNIADKQSGQNNHLPVNSQNPQSNDPSQNKADSNSSGSSVKASRTENRGGFWKFFAVGGLGLFTLFSLIFLFTYVSLESQKSRITVSGSSREEIVYDSASISFAVPIRAEEIEEIESRYNDKIKEIDNYLSVNGIPGENSNITTRDIVQSGDQLELPIIFQVTFDDLENNPERTDDILFGLKELGVETFGDFAYGFAEKEEVCRNLQAEAINDALEKGREMIQSIGGSDILGKEVTPVSDCTSPNGIPSTNLNSGSTFSNPGNSFENSNTLQKSFPPILNNKQTLSQQVYLTIIYR